MKYRKKPKYVYEESVDRLDEIKILVDVESCDVLDQEEIGLEEYLGEETYDELKSLLKTHTIAILDAEIERAEGMKEEGWSYGGGGGIDTDHWCKRGVCFTIPGIKQIVSYGINNDSWWTKYFLKWQVIIPEKYKIDGYNQALTDHLTYLKEQRELINKK